MATLQESETPHPSKVTNLAISSLKIITFHAVFWHLTIWENIHCSFFLFLINSLASKTDKLCAWEILWVNESDIGKTLISNPATTHPWQHQNNDCRKLQIFSPSPPPTRLTADVTRGGLKEVVVNDCQDVRKCVRRSHLWWWWWWWRWLGFYNIITFDINPDLMFSMSQDEVVLFVWGVQVCYMHTHAHTNQAYAHITHLPRTHTHT